MIQLKPSQCVFSGNAQGKPQILGSQRDSLTAQRPLQGVQHRLLGIQQRPVDIEDQMRISFHAQTSG